MRLGILGLKKVLCLLVVSRLVKGVEESYLFHEIGGWTSMLVQVEEDTKAEVDGVARYDSASAIGECRMKIRECASADARAHGR